MRLAETPIGRRVSGAAWLTGVAPELALLSVVGMWASTFIVTKAVFAEISPLAFAFARFGLITPLAFGVLALRGRGAARARYWSIRRADLARFAAAGFTGYTLYQLGFMLGLDRTSPFSSSLLISLVPLFGMLILAFGGERTPSKAWLGIAIALAGVLLFLFEKRGSGGGTVLGDALSLGASVTFAAYGIVNRPLVRDYPPETYSAYTVLAGSIPLLLITTPAAFDQDWGAISALGWLAIAYMVIFPVYLAYMLWNWAIARRGITVATSASLLVPVVSGALSALIFAEGFGTIKLLGAALALTGLIVLRLWR